MKTQSVAARLLIKHGLQYELTYRARAIVWSLQTLLWIFVFPFVWLAVYGDREILNGFNRADLITYFLMLMVMEYLVESYIDNEMHKQIKDGDITNILLKPFKMVWYFYYSHIGYRIVRVPMFLSFIAIAYIFFDGRISVPTEWYTVPLMLVAIVIGNLIAFNLKVMVGCVAFWVEEAEPFRVMYWFLFGMLAGWIGPIAFFPEWVQAISTWLPWQYTLYYPIAIFLEILPIQSMSMGLLIAAVWLLLLTIIRRGVVALSVKKYNAVGR